MRVLTALNVSIDFEAAGMGDRVLAALLDYFLLICYLIGAFWLASEIDSTSVTILLILPYFFYFLVCEIFFNGQSIGKKVRGLKVARIDGKPPTLGDYVLRWLLRFIDLDLTLGLAGLLTVFFNENGQRLGDLAAGTTLIKVRSHLSLRDTLFTRLSEDYTPVFHQVETLADSDILVAKDVLNTLLTQRRSRTTHLLGKKIKAALEQKMALSSPLPPADFLRAVIKDYNHLHGRV